MQLKVKGTYLAVGADLASKFEKFVLHDPRTTHQPQGAGLRAGLQDLIMGAEHYPSRAQHMNHLGHPCRYHRVRGVEGSVHRTAELASQNGGGDASAYQGSGQRQREPHDELIHAGDSMQLATYPVRAAAEVGTARPPSEPTRFGAARLVGAAN